MKKQKEEKRIIIGRSMTLVRVRAVVVVGSDHLLRGGRFWECGGVLGWWQAGGDDCWGRGWKYVQSIHLYNSIDTLVRLDPSNC